MSKIIQNLHPNQFNQEVLNIKHSRNIIKIFENGRNKYALIRNELALRDNTGNLPYYGIQGEDIGYQYIYGKFIDLEPVNNNQNSDLLPYNDGHNFILIRT